MTDVTPLEAKKVWNALGSGATASKVAHAFTMLGRSVSASIIEVWHRKRWKSGEGEGDVVIRLLTAAAPLLTGNRSATYRDVSPDIKAAAEVLNAATSPGGSVASLVKNSEPPVKTDDPLDNMSDEDLIKGSARAFAKLVLTFSDKLRARADDVIENDLQGLAAALTSLSRAQIAGIAGYAQAIAVAEKSMKLERDKATPAPNDGKTIEHEPTLMLAARIEADPLALSLQAWARGARGLNGS